MSFLIIGASSGLGRELAFKFAQEKNNLIIVSRDIRDLNALKSDLELKFKVKVQCIALDFSSLEEINQKLLSNKDSLKDINGILFPIGLMFENDKFDVNVENLCSFIANELRDLIGHNIWFDLENGIFYFFVGNVAEN